MHLYRYSSKMKKFENFQKNLPQVYATPGSHLKSRFFPKIPIYMKKAISTANQGPRSKIMSEKNLGQKSHVSVPLKLSSSQSYRSPSQTKSVSSC